ncbi:putative amidohydrolase YtcJ [Paenibacillus turicensis]|uniref:Amidohydrolase YtcJ n=2 Tax=Paenibacillus turicensis TaxID=160487 RepID=A0ABS4FQF7_9BACL|nr:amidohydrolase [Paenibacillus turicensis]MBP1904795.1 putative amidohydrolase YtcJ [Paenibacillus turicensis]
MSGTLYINGTFPMLSGESKLASRFVDAIFVEQGKIAAIGTKSDLKLQLGAKVYQTIDLAGGVVLPGLTDSHMHLSMHGMKLSMLDFSGVTSKTEMLAMIREEAQKTPVGQWIVGLNWNENEFTTPELPHISELDDITMEHPIFLTRVCFHAYVGNSIAFRLAGITQDTPDTPSGSFGRDEQGKLNGMVYEEAHFAFTKAQPEPDYSTKKEIIKRACLDALSLGLTSVHTEDLRFIGNVDTMHRIHQELHEEGIYIRTHQLLYHPYMSEIKELGIKAGDGNEWFKMGAIKLFADGAIGARTALLQQPYSDMPEVRGTAIHSQEELEELTVQARKLGFPIAVHAIGDGAAQMVLTAMENCPLPVHAPLRDRFIHAQVLNEDLIKRMKKLPLIIDIQPRFVVSDFPWVLDRVGAERTEYLYAWRKLLAAGLICGGGSDAPIEPLNPFLGIHAAVTRKKPSQNQQFQFQSEEGYLPLEKLSMSEAISLFTMGGAATVNEAGERGSIEVGKAADFTVINDNPLQMDHPDQLLDVQIQMTVVNGRIAYQAN